MGRNVVYLLLLSEASLLIRSSTELRLRRDELSRAGSL